MKIYANTSGLIIRLCRDDLEEMISPPPDEYAYKIEIYNDNNKALVEDLYVYQDIYAAPNGVLVKNGVPVTINPSLRPFVMKSEAKSFMNSDDPRTILNRNILRLVLNFFKIVIDGNNKLIDAYNIRFPEDNIPRLPPARTWKQLQAATAQQIDTETDPAS